ncbi:APC family permease [Leekyejoonella antrihumi]|nr:APC family permease [Leekyejoonella antrihumi]
MSTMRQIFFSEHVDKDVTGEERLEQLGYESHFDRRLNLWGNMSLTLSDITPMGSLLAIGIAVIALAGTGSVIAYLAGVIIAVMVALCMAELGSIYPVSGGIYSIIGKVLGQHAAFVTLVAYIVEGVFLPATIALGIGTYAQSLSTALSIGVYSAIGMAIVTVLALMNIQSNALMTGIFLAIEVIIIVIIAVAGFTNLTQPISVYTHADGMVNGKLTSLGLGVIVGAVSVALQSVNGYDAGIAFAEETTGPARRVGKSVLYMCIVGGVLELAAFLGAAFGTPSLSKFLTSSTPLTYVVKARWGDTVGTIVVVGAIIALFNACLAITLQFARIFWASARDKVWPDLIGKPLSRTWARTHAPWVTTLIIGVIAIILCLSLSIVATATFVAVFTIANYVFIAVAAIWQRISSPDGVRPFAMILWPLPPIIAGVGSLLAISKQTYTDLIIVGCLFALGLIYSLTYLRRKGLNTMTLMADAEQLGETPR